MQARGPWGSSSYWCGAPPPLRSRPRPCAKGWRHGGTTSQRKPIQRLHHREETLDGRLPTDGYRSGWTMNPLLSVTFRSLPSISLFPTSSNQNGTATRPRCGSLHCRRGLPCRCRRMIHGRLTKQANKWLRWAFIEAVTPAVRKPPYLRRYYERIRTRRGRKIRDLWGPTVKGQVPISL